MTSETTGLRSFDKRLQQCAKCLFGRSFALIALLTLTPLMLGIAAAVKLDSRGPVIFRQARTGQNGKVFYILKFRSMQVNASMSQARRNDQRVTRVGAVLRKTSLDELPQLVNVLMGDMALVGPRPHAVAHDEFYAPQIGNYMMRYAVKPGMTGWAQINNARGETETVEKMARRAALDLQYVQNWSLLLDLRILIATPLALIRTDAAY
jgi:putative colanic acid biosynthesis UDP-glucose lipid carrier transferase